MKADDLALGFNDVRFEDLVSQTAIQTNEDKVKYQSKGYTVKLTELEFMSMFDLDPKMIWYIPACGSGCLYFNEDTLAVCVVYIQSLIDAEQSKSGDYNLETIKHVIKSVEQQVQENKFYLSLLCLPAAMKMEYFNKLVSKKRSKIPNLYNLFLGSYTESDYGFIGIKQETLDYIFNSKTPNEKRKTTMRLKHLLAHQANPERPSLRHVPDTITVYRGENSASASYEFAYSWSLNIRGAKKHAIRRGNGSAIVRKGEVNRKDVLEYIDSRGEQEIIVNPSSVRNIQTVHLSENDITKLNSTE